MTHVGLHISKGKSKSLYGALIHDIKIYNINAVQIFVAVPRSGKSIKFKEKELEKIKKIIQKQNIILFVHTAYITTMIWNDKPYGIKLLKDQMKLAVECGAEGIVLHLPKKSCQSIVATLEKYKDYINSIKVKLLFEPPAFKANKTCSFEMPDKLNRLTNAIKSIGLKRWGYTIDTAHLWSSITEEDRKEGLKIETYKGANNWIKALSKETIKKIKLIHLNGSHSLTGKDEHAIPVYGIKPIKGNNITEKPDYMWGHISNLFIDNQTKKINIKHLLKKTSLYRFIKFAKTRKISIILEVNVGTSKQIINSLNLINFILN